MKRYIYAFDSIEPARVVITKLKQAGIAEAQLSLVASSQTQIEQVPDRYLDVSKDFVPAAARGAAIGGATGVIAGLIAMAIPPLGIAVGGAALIGFFAGGAAVGAWASALVGASVPDEVRRKFEDEIKAGRILLVVDSNGSNDAEILAVLGSGSDRHLVWQSEIEIASAGAK